MILKSESRDCFAFPLLSVLITYGNTQYRTCYREKQCVWDCGIIYHILWLCLFLKHMLLFPFVLNNGSEAVVAANHQRGLRGLPCFLFIGPFLSLIDFTFNCCRMDSCNIRYKSIKIPTDSSLPFKLSLYRLSQFWIIIVTGIVVNFLGEVVHGCNDR